MHSGFEDFVRTRGDTLRRFAYLLCGDQHVGEDLVQDVLIRAYRRWSSIHRPESCVRTALVRAHVSWLRRRLPDGGGVCATLAMELGDDVMATVGGRRAVLRTDEVAVDLGGRVLTVYPDPERFPMDVPALIRFAAAITPR